MELWQTKAMAMCSPRGLSSMQQVPNNGSAHCPIIESWETRLEVTQAEHRDKPSPLPLSLLTTGRRLGAALRNILEEKLSLWGQFNRTCEQTG